MWLNRGEAKVEKAAKANANHSVNRLMTVTIRLTRLAVLALATSRTQLLRNPLFDAEHIISIAEVHTAKSPTPEGPINNEIAFALMIEHRIESICVPPKSPVALMIRCEILLCELLVAKMRRLFAKIYFVAIIGNATTSE